MFWIQDFLALVNFILSLHSKTKVYVNQEIFLKDLRRCKRKKKLFLSNRSTSTIIVAQIKVKKKLLYFMINSDKIC